MLSMGEQSLNNVETRGGIGIFPTGFRRKGSRPWWSSSRSLQKIDNVKITVGNTCKRNKSACIMPYHASSVGKQMCVAKWIVISIGTPWGYHRMWDHQKGSGYGKTLCILLHSQVGLSSPWVKLKAATVPWYS